LFFLKITHPASPTPKPPKSPTNSTVLPHPPAFSHFSNPTAEFIRRITDDINARLERFIRLYPEQYLWAHRRWR